MTRGYGYEREILEEWEAVWGRRELPRRVLGGGRLREGSALLRYLRPIPCRP